MGIEVMSVQLLKQWMEVVCHHVCSFVNKDFVGFLYLNVPQEMEGSLLL